ncbi:MAG: tRNA (adenosine(37)-N6)-threonylcarbamoyltransferase complex ATPase subunit type 1 TsaE [Campylobacterota bacterium]|nr:tRNA (adenosine(37)-N6)-threonylcarbamoyltransferase complex ATPase subunit type 1 TsaE [Campylobacterota bacterium]
MKFNLGLEELNSLIEYLNQQLEKKDIVVLLQGDLASGKTTLVKSYVKSVGIDDDVTSPTFSLQSIYGDNIYHYDVYNKTLEEFISLGLLEEFEKSGVHFVEWGDDKLEKILEEYGFEVLKISIEKNENKREYTIGS